MRPSAVALLDEPLTLDDLHGCRAAVLASLASDFRIVGRDGSRDGSLAGPQGIADTDPDDPRCHSGKPAAGSADARGKTLATRHGDEEPIAGIEQGADPVAGRKRSRQDPWALLRGPAP